MRAGTGRGETGRLRIAPSILAADFARLGEEVKAVAAAGADELHIDIMDGQFVPDITFGPAMVRALRPLTGLRFHVHLMTGDPDRHIGAFADAGADLISVHPEATVHIHRTLGRIRALGKQAGVAVNPGTAPAHLAYLLDMLDRILVMTVNPGFGGQVFIESQVDKIAAFRRQIDLDGLPVLLEVDGGINRETAAVAAAAGADIAVAGTAVFSGGPARYQANIDRLRHG